MIKKHKGMFFELDYGRDLKVDLKDKKILSVIGNNCRSQNKAIGKIVGLGKDSIRYRIKELAKKDIYRGNLSIINPFALGVQINTLLIKLEKINPKKEEEIIEFFENSPYVVWVGQTQGAYDYNINIMAFDIVHFDKIIKEIRVKLQGYLKEMKILHLSKMYCCNTLPLSLRKEAKLEKINLEKTDSITGHFLKRIPFCSHEDKKINLDRKDALVLREIANNANLTLQEISNSTKIPADTVKNRLIGLVKNNVIIAFRASINVSYLNFHGHIAYFRLHPHLSEDKRKKFEDYFKNKEYVSFVSETYESPYDFQIYIFAKNPLDFNKILKKIREDLYEYIEDHETVLILKDYKFTFFPEGAITPFKKLFLDVVKHF
jgi:Lrp/AsnC family transcriptional regulator, leucine-responsive regulatory protein